MFKSVTELKAFVQWASKNGVKRIKVADVEIEISDIAHIPELRAPQTSQVKRKASKKSNLEAADITQPEAEPKDDPDLFWSVTN